MTTCRSTIVTILFLTLTLSVSAQLRYSEVVEAKLNSGTVSYFLESKRGPDKNDKCEDGVFFSDDFLLVVDGASDKSGVDYEGRTGGWICKETIVSVFREASGTEEPEVLLARINEKLRKTYARYKIDYLNNPEFRFSAVLIWYNFNTRTLHALGDCKARIDGELYNAEEKGVDQLNSEFRVRVLEVLGVDLKEPASRDLGREYILPLLKAQSRYQNNPKAPEGLQYWVVDGTDIPTEQIQTWEFKNAPKVIELSSDGYAEFPKQREVSGYEKLLAELLKEDPSLTTRVKSTKGLKKGNVSFDDRSILIYKR